DPARELLAVRGPEPERGPREVAGHGGAAVRVRLGDPRLVELVQHRAQAGLGLPRAARADQRDQRTLRALEVAREDRGPDESGHAAEQDGVRLTVRVEAKRGGYRSEEHTSELQSLA